MSDGDIDPSVHLTVGVDTHIWGLNYATLRAYSLARSGTQVRWFWLFAVVLLQDVGLRPTCQERIPRRSVVKTCYILRPRPAVVNMLYTPPPTYEAVGVIFPCVFHLFCR